MKALSLLQPWASAVVQGFKPWETRSWQTSYRGKILIHASYKWTKNQLHIIGSDPFDKFFKKPFEIPVGMIIGSVDLVDCMTVNAWYDMTIRERWTTDKILDYKGMGDFNKGRYVWHFQNPVGFEHPVPANGSLRFWEFQQCRECGCSYYDPCIDEKGGHCCAWSEIDLCNCCADKVETTILRNFPTFISKPNHILNPI